jgi:ubiquinone/menaquinone biosynthesis C-methylase UbiE
MSLVTEAYNKDPEREWQRLVRDPYHSLEFLVTMHYLRKHLPPEGKVLDAGGGPGRYSLELCRAGYEVVLLDISSELIATARKQFELEPKVVRDRLIESVVGDVQNLSHFEANHFDVVLCLGGPLTHISNAVGRLKAMSELVRVAKPGAVVAVSVMGFFAVIRTILMRFSDELVEPSFQILVQRGDTTVAGMIWHFFRADELRELAESCGLTTLEMAGCEGLSTGLVEATNLLSEDEGRWERWEELVLKTASEPALVDMAEHILYLGRV